MNKVILLEGLDCASCASELEEILSAVKGVSDVSVDFIGQKVRLDCADGTRCTGVTVTRVQRVTVTPVRQAAFRACRVASSLMGEDR